jgi:hypothetical protein
MDAQTQSRVRLTLHAIERHSLLLIEAVDASMVELTPECVRWGAVSDPRRWLSPTLCTFDQRHDSIRRQVLDLAARYAAVADDIERFISAGAAGHDCDAKATLREDFVSIARELTLALQQWVGERHAAGEPAVAASSIFPQYVPRAVPNAARDDRHEWPAVIPGGKS